MNKYLIHEYKMKKTYRTYRTRIDEGIELVTIDNVEFKIEKITKSTLDNEYIVITIKR